MRLPRALFSYKSRRQRRYKIKDIFRWRRSGKDDQTNLEAQEEEEERKEDCTPLPLEFVCEKTTQTHSRPILT
jgi:hypothetical protein